MTDWLNHLDYSDYVGNATGLLMLILVAVAFVKLGDKQI